MPKPYQTLQEAKESIRQDLLAARDLIQEHVSSQCGNHICLPFSVGSDMAIDVMKEIGAYSCFWGVIRGRKANYPSGDAYHAVRIKNDFLWRLPGIGRKSLVSVYGMKLKRRLKSEPVY